MTTGKKDKMKDLRIGVFICDCGSNIAGHLDCREVTEYAATLPGVVFAKENLYTCSEAGILEIQEAIKKHNLNRVVVASCSPRTHQPLFQNSCESAGLNPYLFEMVNIRDQCSWVHMQDRGKATQKAKDLVRMGVAKAAFLELQQDIESPLTPRVGIVGGGVAGLSAAEGLSRMGLEVVLVEKSRELGGLLRNLHKLAPDRVDALEMVERLVQEVSERSNVKIFTGAELKGLDGYVGNYVMSIRCGDEPPVKESVGCLVIAIGAVPLMTKGLFNHDGSRVITQMELESRLKKGDLHTKEVVMIQCAGARNQERSYCSRICCMIAVKNAMLIKEMTPDARVHILYRDMQMYGTEKEKMLWDARGMGVRFDVYDPASPPEVKEDSVKFTHPLLGREMEIPCDLVVLSTPLIARQDASTLSQLLRVPMDQNGFFLEAHAKLRPLDFAADGIFVAGSCRYPSTYEEARAQGMGAAARVGTILFKDKLVTSAIVAEINPDTCVGCMGCLQMCPYGAITYDQEKRVCEVNEVLCKGCGCCAATCPSESAALKGFKPQQLMSQIRAVMEV